MSKSKIRTVVCTTTITDGEVTTEYHHYIDIIHNNGKYVTKPYIVDYTVISTDPHCIVNHATKEYFLLVAANRSFEEIVQALRTGPKV